MKTNLVLTIAAILLATTSVNAQFAGGDGSEEDPYQITTITELNEVRNQFNKHFILNNDLDFNGSEYQSGEGWLPINDYSDGFMGSFKGNNHTISNLYINRSSTDYIGLFGYTDNAAIYDLGLINCNVSGNNKVGGLIGHRDGSTIENCYSTGVVSGNEDIGGLIGCCLSNAIVGNCYSTVSVTGVFQVGGLIGYNSSSVTIANCYSTGAVSGSYSRVGGLVGTISSTTIANCYSTGVVSGDQNVGGFVGFVDYSTIEDCYYDSETSNQYSGIGNGSDQTVTSLTTAEMKQEANFNNWDFATIWGIDEGVSYPYLRPTSLVAISEISKLNISVYPNPFIDKINLINADKIIISDISIYDISGKEVLSKKYNGENTINLSSLKPATYFIKLNDENKNQKLIKIIKQ